MAEPEEEVYLRTPFNEGRPRISSDGAWIAYASDESGQSEVYVRPLSGNAGQVKVSMNGGSWPVWSPDGTELLGIDASNGLVPRTGDLLACPLSGDDCRVLAPDAAQSAWSVDGEHAYFQRRTSKGRELYEVPADGTAEPRLVTVIADFLLPSYLYTVGPDGTVYYVGHAAGRRELWMARLE